MNKVFRVIWNISSQTWVVVSELARGRIKSSTNNSAINQSGLVLGGILSIVSAIPISAEAARSVREVGISNVHIETNASAQSTSSALGNILIGPSAEVGGTSLPTGIGITSANSAYNSNHADNNIVIGNSAISAGKSNVVLGFGAKTFGSVVGASVDQIAIGTDSFAAGTSSIALGKSTFTNSRNGIAIGTSSRSMGERAIAIGESSRAATDGVALGSNANATFAHSIAIGHASVTNSKATQEGNIVVDGVTYDSAAGAVPNTAETSSYVVSVGNETIKRQIKNVAPGKISADSTDAINGSQLFQITKGLQGRPITFEGNEGSVSRHLGETLQIQGGGTGGDFSATNVKTVGAGNKVEIQFAQSPTFVNLVTTGTITAARAIQANGGLTIGANQNVSMGNNRVTQVLAGTQATDAVNKGQLDAISNLQFSADNPDSGTIALQTGTLGIKGTSNYVQTNRNGSDVTINLADSVRTKLDNLAANPNETYANKNLGNIDTAGVNKIKQHAKEAINIQGDNRFTNVSKNNTTGQDVYTVSVNEQVVKTTAQNAINVAGNGDVTVSPSITTQNGVKTFTVGLDKATAITADSTKAATSQAVYNAIVGARTQVTSNDNSVTVNKTDANGLGHEIYNLSVNTAKVIESLNGTFAKKDASNITPQAQNWRDNLSVYSKAETAAEINKAKETVEAGTGISVASEDTTSGGKQFTVSVKNDHIKQQAKEAIKVVEGTNTTVQENTDSSGAKTYAVNVNLTGLANTDLGNLSNTGKTEIKKVAKDAIAAVGSDDVTVSPSTDNANNVKTFTFGLNKATTISATEEKAATAKAVYEAVSGAKTQVSSDDNSITIEKTEPNDLGANIYKLSVNTTKVIESLNGTFAKTDASNIADHATKWRETLSVYSKTEANNEINKAKESVSVGAGLQVSSDTINSTGGKEFLVSLNESHINNLAKNAIAATGSSDISVSTTPDNTNGPKAFTFSLNKAAAITENDEKVATAKAVHSAIVGAKTQVSSTDQSVNITANQATGLNANTYDISVNTTKVIADLDSTFARTNASNINGQANAWRNALEVYSRTETNTEINKAKETVESGVGISVQHENTATDGQKFTVSVDNAHLKQQAQQAVKLANGTNTIVQENDSDGNKTYTVNVNLDDRANTSLSNLADAGKTEVKKLAKEAIVATGNSDVSVLTTGADNTSNAKTFTFGLNKADAITATEEKVATAKAVHDAIVGAKTQVSSSDDSITVQATEQVGITPNSYSLSLNLPKLTQDLSNTFVQISNLGATSFTYKANGTERKSTALSQGLDFVNSGNLTIEARNDGVVAIGLDATTKTDIAKRETVVGSDGVTVTSSNNNETGGKEFSVSLDNNYIDGRAKAAVKVANGDNTTVSTTNNENGTITYAVNVDLSNVAQTDLSNLKIEGQNQVKTLAKQAIDVTNADNFTSVAKDTQNGKDTYRISVNQDTVKSAAHSAIEVSNGTDIGVNSTTSDGVKTFALTLNKANTITQDNTNVVTAKAVHSAIAAAKTTVNATGDIVTIERDEKTGIEANSYTISVNTSNLKATLNDTFAKVDATNLGTNVPAWRAALDVYNKEETRNEINNAKETVKGSTGINVDAQNVIGKGQEFTVSLDNNHIKAQAKSAVEVTGDNHFTTVSKDTGNTDKDVYTVSVSEQAVKAAAQAAIAATGTDDVNVIASTNDSKSLKTFAVSLNKANSITADDEKAATAKAVHKAIADAKTTVNSGDDFVTVQENAQSGIVANSYGISLNTNKLTEHLTNTFAKADASNIAQQATNWRNALNVYDKTETNSRIEQAKESVKGSTGINVSSRDVEGKGQEFTVSVDNEHIKTQAKEAVKVINGTNTTVQTDTDTSGATTYAVNVDLSNLADKNLSNLTEEGNTVVKDLAKSVVDVTNGDNFTIVQKEQKDGKDSYKVSLNEQAVKSTVHNAIAISNNSDISAAPTTDNGVKTFALTLNKANTITQDDTKAATSQAVYSAISAAKTTVDSNSNIVTVTKEEKDGIEANSYTISVNTDHLKTTLNDTFAKVDSSNIGNNAAAWRDTLSVYDKAETDSKINQAKETVEGGVGINVVPENTPNGGQKFTVSVDDSHIKAQAKSAVEVKSGNTFATVEKDQSSTDKDIYTVSVSEQAVKAAAQDAVAVTGNADVTVAASTNDTQNLKTFAVSLNKANSITADDEKVTTAKVVHSAIANAKTTVTADDELVTIRGTAQNGITANNYGISLNTDKLKTNLADTFAKSDATNIGATQATAWRNALDVYNKAQTNTEIAKAKESVKAGAGITVIPKEVAGKGQEFTVAVDDSHIKTQAKQAVKVVNGNNTSVTEGTEGDAKTFRVDVDLSNYATNNALSNAQISYKANSGEAKSTLLSQGLNFTNTGNLAITAKDNGVIELGLDDETKTKLNVRETVIQGTGIVVNGDTNNDTGGKQFTVSVDNNHIKAQAKDAVKVMAQENDDLIIVNSAAGQNGELNYQVGVNKQAVTSAVQNAITATGNDDIEVNAATQNGIKNFSIGLNKAAQLAANEDKVASAGTVYSAVTGAKTTVSSSDDSVEFKTKTESNDLNANHYDISVNTNKLRQDLGDTFAKVDASNIATKAAEWRTALNVYNQAETDTAINRAKETVVAGTGVNVASESTADNGQKFTVSVKNDHIQAQAKEAVKVAAQDSDNFVSVTTDDSTGSTVYKVGVDQQAVTSAAKNAIQVTGNMDISVDTENDTAKTFALTLNKATEVVEGENKALTADAAYKAITGAKTTVAAGDNLVTVTPTESDDLTRNQYSVALNTTALKTHLSTSLNDIFATVNASNIGPQASAWRTALDVYNKTETNDAINLAKETVVNGTGVTVSTGKNSSGAQEFTVALDNSHIQAQAKQAISVTGDADVQVNASEKEGKQDFALSLTKATRVEANNASALTSGAAYTAITEAKTKVTSKDALLTLTKTAESDNLIANEYDIALNRSTLKTHLTESLNDTFAKADASNITAKAWRDTLNVYDKTETDSAINAISTLRFTGDSGSSSIALQTGTLGFKGQAGYLETHGHGSDITIQLANGVKNKLDNLADNPNAVYTNQSLSNLNGQGIAKIKEQVGIENGLNTTAIAEEKDGVKTFKVNVDLSEYQKTAELGNTLLSYKANGGEDQTTSLTSGLDFQNKGNLTIATKDNGVVELSLDAQTVKDIAVRETVVAGTGITVTDTETNDTDGKQFRIAVDNAHIKNQAREAVQVAAANNDEFVTVIPNSNTNSGNTTYQVAVSKQAVQAAAKDAVTVTGNSDILVDTKNNAADKSFTLSIDKAKTVTENEEKVVTSGAVYSAVADAKSKVTTDDKFITLTPTESNDLKANQYHLALNTDNLKVHLTENLNDTFAKQDASNVQAGVWRSVLDVLSSSELSSAMNALGWTLKVNQEAEGEKITNDSIVTFNQDQNIEINREGNHINIKTVEAPTFSRVNTGTIITTGSATVGGMLQANGGFTVGERQTVNLGNNVVSGVATGVEETDATNVKQVKDLVANSAWKLSTGSTNEGIDETLDTLAEEDINPNDQVKLQAGKNLKVKREANGVVTYATQDNVSFANVNTDSLNVAGATTLSQLTVNGATVFNRGFGVASGQTVDMGGNRLQNVGNAQNDSDAVNYAQLKSISQSLTDKGLSFEGNSGNTTRKLGETLQIVGGDSTGQFSSKNVHTVVTDGKVEVQIAERPTFERVDANEVNAKSVIGEQGRFNGLIADNATLGSKNGTLNIVEGTSINLGGNVLHNLGKGIADTDATNVGQVKELVADSAWTLASGAVEGGVDETVLSEDEKINPNDQLKLQAGKNLKVKREANGVVTYATQDNVSFANVNTGSLNVAGVATLNQLTVNGTTMFNRGFGVASGQIVDMGGNRVQNIGDAKEQGDAVNLKQLQEMSSNLTQAGLNFSGNQGETERHLGQTIAIEGKATTEGPYSSGNIQTVVENGKVEIQIAESPKFDNVEVNQLQAVGLATKNANISDNLTVSGNTTLGGQGKNLTVKEGTTVHMGGNVVSGIANGDISPNSSDAVNGRQLYAIQQLVGQGDSKGSSTTIINSDGTTQNVQISQSNGYTLTTYNVEAQKEYRTNNVIEAIGRMNEQGIKFFHTNDGVVKPDVQGDNTVDSSASGKYATAVGFQAKANGENSVSFGKGSQALGKDTISIGTGNIVSGNNSGALGDPSIVSGDNSYVIGNDNTVTTQNTFVVGNNVTKTVDNSVFLGADTGYVVDGKTTKGNAAYTSQVIDGQTYQYAGGKAEEVVGVVSVGHVNPNGSMQTRRIQNVAPGLISENSTDAVNGSQLHSLTHFVNQGWELNTGVVDGTNGIAESAAPTKIGLGNSVKINAGQNIVVTQNGQSLDLATSMAPTFNSLKLNQGGTVDMGGNRIQNVGNAVNPTDALNYGQFKAELNQVDSRLRSGIAGAVASASLVQAFNPSESILAVGGGTYRGASAVSLGYSKVSDNGRIIFKLSGSANNYGDFMGGASVGFKF